ncbi:MAG: hypothetical protein B7X39_14210 [Lysobacterales bacterium 14-68-21]|jgi:hypothetical protein|nr:MAG: hypothetical protein B7X45_13100 [Xanthomonadales bacterium 15-68-25]OZB65400.1 MAG: hypothetical protein B7X39_14210 [Xanthomonadales bacterium 14-68-21]
MSDDFDLETLAESARKKRQEALKSDGVDMTEAMEKLGQVGKVAVQKAKESTQHVVEKGKQAASSEQGKQATEAAGKAIGKAVGVTKALKGRLGSAWWSTGLALVIGLVLVGHRFSSTPPTDDQVFAAVATAQNINNMWPYSTGSTRGKEGIFSNVEQSPLDSAHPFVDVANVRVGSCRRSFGGSKGLPAGVNGEAWTCGVTFDAVVNGQPKKDLTESVRLIRATSDKDQSGRSAVFCSSCSMSWAFASTNAATDLSAKDGNIVHIASLPTSKEAQP